MSIFTKKKVEPKPIYITLDDEEYESIRGPCLMWQSGEKSAIEEYWKVARNICLSRGIVLDMTKQYTIDLNILAHSIRITEKPW